MIESWEDRELGWTWEDLEVGKSGEYSMLAVFIGGESITSNLPNQHNP